MTDPDDAFTTGMKMVAVKTGLPCGGALLFSEPMIGFSVLALIATVWLAFAVRRHRLALDPNGLTTTRFAGIGRRHVPYSQIDRLEIEGQELVARDARGKVLCRCLERQTARLMETFCEIQAGMDRCGRI
ncbi:MAG: EbsA family protein [Polyangiaceae bacterium]|nr:EbsA family protein [Polyangiaceae bacterium]